MVELSRSNKEAEGLQSLCFACQTNSSLQIYCVVDHEYKDPFRANYSECRNCNSLYQIPMPSSEELASFYPNNYHSFNENGLLTKVRFYMRLRRIKPFLNKNDSLLDFGCGNGSFLYYAAKALPECRFFGYEIASKTEIYRSESGALTIVRGDIEALWKLLPCCHLITINHTIEHLPKPERTMRELFEKLCSGGYIEGQTPAADSLERFLFRSYWSGYHAPRHTVIFSRSGLRSLLSRVGFDKIRISPAFNPAACAVSIGSLLHGPNPGEINRRGAWWFLLICLGAAFALIDFSSRASGVINFRASK